MATGTNAPFGLRPTANLVGGAFAGKVNEYNIYANANGATTYSSNLFIGDPVVHEPAYAVSISDATLVNFPRNYISLYTPGMTPVPNGATTFSIRGLLGTFQGCRYQSNVTPVNNFVKFPRWPANQQVVAGSIPTAYILDDPTMEYEIQISTYQDAANGNFTARPWLPVHNSLPDAANSNFLTRSGGTGSNFALNIGGGTNFNTVTDAYVTATGKTYANNPTTGNLYTNQSGYYLDASTASSAAFNTVEEYDKTLDTLPLKFVGYSLQSDNKAAYPLTLGETPFLIARVKINNGSYTRGTQGTLFA